MDIKYDEFLENSIIDKEAKKAIAKALEEFREKLSEQTDRYSSIKVSDKLLNYKDKPLQTIISDEEKQQLLKELDELKTQEVDWGKVVKLAAKVIPLAMTLL